MQLLLLPSEGRRQRAGRLIKLFNKYNLAGLVLIILGLLLSGCGNLETPEAATATPRPSPVLATPTPAAPTFSIAITPALTIRPTETAGRSGNVTATRPPQFTATPAPTAIVVAPPAITTPPRSVRAIGGDLLSAQEREPVNFQPYSSFDQVSQQYRAMLYDAKLLQRNPQTLDWETHAAQAFRYDDAQRTVIMVLKPGLKWSDGQAITAADYSWTYEQAIDPGKNWTEAARYVAAIESYTAADSRTIVVKLRDRFSDPFEVANMVEPLPKHIWEGQSWSEADRNKEILNPTVISGAWKFKEWVKKERVTFVRNEASSVTPPPYLNSLTFLYIPDSRKAVAMLARGELDFYVPPPDRYATMREAGKIITYRWNPAVPDWNYLGFNYRRVLPGEVVFRRAIAAVTDRAALIDQVNDGRGTPMYSDVPPGHPAYLDNVEKYSGGLAQARFLLQIAGYSWRESDGRLLDRQGRETPELSLLYNSESQARAKIASYFQGQLALLGVTVRLISKEYLSYVNQLKQSPYDYDLYLGGWKSRSSDLAQFGLNWKNNFSGYNNPELSNLYQKAAHEPDKTARNALLAQVQQLEARDLPYLYLYAEQGYIGALFPIGGISDGTGPLGPMAAQFSDWYIK